MEMKSGFMVEEEEDGLVYEGLFRKGERTGSGVLYSRLSDGGYEGDWLDGYCDGYGVETTPFGSRYEGQLSRSFKDGVGVYRFYTGEVYSGEWWFNMAHGRGVFTAVDGGRYVGYYKWGDKHGLGHYHYSNGETYAGQFANKKLHGFGVYIYADGTRYEGAWRKSKREGLGLCTCTTGETKAGYWRDDTLEVPSNMVPVTLSAVSHLEVLKAAQKARRAAEKASDIPNVDDRVDRAIAAANRAAEAAKVAARLAKMPSRFQVSTSPIQAPSWLPEPFRSLPTPPTATSLSLLVTSSGKSVKWKES